ncbi:hypothetical protein [Streptomyces boncukensis]|uniref:Uncharacterized protein n=1 Tax=Streptomyces boncukensis TaxID=2711219 RepID=A0A6G4X6F5_9ACTN|nr:hypothetical protein [Streptomyces boncukensis]NGO72833.1 hypothetical protein [Streptomyces boncukensis]
MTTVKCGCGGAIRINNQGRPQCDRCGQYYGYAPPPPTHAGLHRAARCRALLARCHAARQATRHRRQASRRVLAAP